MLDRETLNEFLTALADRFTGAEIVDRLEDAGILTVEDVINALEEYIIEGKNELNS